MTSDEYYTDRLVSIWGDEWTSLSSEHQALVLADYMQADAKARLNYRRNIYVGNLAKYAECLVVGDGR